MIQEGASLQWSVVGVVPVVPCSARRLWSLRELGHTLPEASRLRVLEEDTRMRRLGEAGHQADMEEALRPIWTSLVSLGSSNASFIDGAANRVFLFQQEARGDHP